MKFFLLLAVLLLPISRSHAAFEDYAEALQAGADNMVAQNYADARVDYNEALKLASTNDQKNSVQLLLANVDLVERKYDDARTRLAKLLSDRELSASTKFQARIAVGSTHVLEGNYDKARAEFDQALQIQGVPTLLWSAQFQKALSFFQEKRYAEARTQFKKLYDYQKDNPLVILIVHLYLGRSYLAEKNFEEARKEFLSVIALKQSDISGEDVVMDDITKSVIHLYKQQAYIEIAGSYLVEKKYVRAKEEYTKILRMEDVDPQIKATAERQLKLIAELEAHQEQPKK